MEKSAMSVESWDGNWEPLVHNLDEWLLFQNGLDDKEVNDSSVKRSKYEIAEQVLHDIENLERNTFDDWLEEFPLFEEIQSLTPSEEFEEGKACNSFEEGQSSPNEYVVSESQKQPSVNTDLFSVALENAATFVLSNENILYVNDQPYVNLVPTKHPKEIQPEEKNGRNVSWAVVDGNDVKMEMAVVEEIIKNTALELDQWESDSSRSETSSDGTSVSCYSPEGKSVETDDPDWKPDSPEVSGKPSKRPKPYSRGGSQEEKRLRKKEQNKNAATRYRQKKKAEVNEILKEENMLKEKKAKLEEKVADIQNEIKYLKGLMRDLFRAKGVIN